MAVLCDRLDPSRQLDAAWLITRQLEVLVGDRNDFCRPPAKGLGLQRALMAEQCIAVHGFAAQPVTFRQVVRCGDHVHCGCRVIKGLPEKVLELHGAAQRKAVAMGVGGNRVAGHGFRRNTQRHLPAIAHL